MKLTFTRLRQIIKEELIAANNSNSRFSLNSDRFIRMKISQLRKMISEQLILNQNSLMTINENFYLATDEEHKRPVSKEILDVILEKLPGSKSAQNLKPVEASGAEGIVFSLDDYRVIKLFHSLENAMKLSFLYSKKTDYTANVYSAGKITLDIPVIYFREKSAYSSSDAEPTTTIYYVVMQRVNPDEETYNSIENAYDRYVRVSKIQFKDLEKYVSLNDDGLNKHVDTLLKDFLQEQGQTDVSGSAFEYIKSRDRKLRNQLIAAFPAWSKKQTKRFLFSDSSSRPLLLKNFILNDVGAISTADFNTSIFREFLLATPEFSRPSKSGKAVSENFIEVENLIKEITVENKVPWKDIHKGQFGRRKDGKLIALDLGVKQNEDKKGSSIFDTNVSKVSLRGKSVKVVESKNLKKKK